MIKASPLGSSERDEGKVSADGFINDSAYANNQR